MLGIETLEHELNSYVSNPAITTILCILAHLLLHEFQIDLQHSPNTKVPSMEDFEENFLSIFQPEHSYFGICPFYR